MSSYIWYANIEPPIKFLIVLKLIPIFSGLIEFDAEQVSEIDSKFFSKLFYIYKFKELQL